MLYQLSCGSLSFRHGLRRKHIPVTRPFTSLVQPWISRLLAKFRRSPDPLANLREEPLDWYYTRGGGYHPVHIGDTYQNSRYTVVRKLGWGYYSTVWLARDELLDRHVALKVLMQPMKGALPSPEMEVPMLKRVNESDDSHPGKAHILRMLDTFKHEGPNGLHDCVTFGVQGNTVLSLQQAYPNRALPIDLVKRISRQMLLALDFTHRCCGLVHTDIKPNNILMVIEKPEEVIENYLSNSNVSMHPTKARSPHKPKYIVESECIPIDLEQCMDNIQFKLADFGSACFIGEPTCPVIYSPALRAPEVMIGAPWGFEADIWALGCIIYELSIGRFMFNVTPPDDLPLSEEEYHLLLVVTLLGDLPLDFIKKGEWSDSFFDLESGKLRGMDISEDANSTLAEVVGHWAPESLAESERAGLVDLLSRMIRIVPQDRETAQELLEHPWLQSSDQPHIPPPPPFDISRPISPPPQAPPPPPSSGTAEVMPA